MADIIERLRFDAARCEACYSKGIATNIEEAANKIERLRAAIKTYLTPDRTLTLDEKLNALRSALEQA
jgi:hypothetical protein